MFTVSQLSEDAPPIDVFIPIEPFLNVSKEQRNIGVVVYNSSQQFVVSLEETFSIALSNVYFCQIPESYKPIWIFSIFTQTNSSTALESEVIRIETAGREIKNLMNPLVINFPVNRREVIRISDHITSHHSLVSFLTCDYLTCSTCALFLHMIIF